MATQADLPETWRELSKISARAAVPAVGELTVLVGASALELGAFTKMVWEQIDSFCNAHGMPETPVSEEELRLYFQTALHTRVARVRNERIDIRVEDRWALPYPMQYVVSAIGRVELESPAVVLVPQMAPKVDRLDRAQWDSVSRRLRSLVPLGLRVASALEAKREGVARVMRLMITEQGDDILIEDTQLFSVTDALTARSASLRVDSSQVPEETARANNPVWATGYTMWGRELITFQHKYVEAGINRASA